MTISSLSLTRTAALGLVLATPMLASTPAQAQTNPATLVEGLENLLPAKQPRFRRSGAKVSKPYSIHSVVSLCHH
ncbi:MAG: hypothetical protein H7Z15_23220 [Rhizobacter sp.]|nr:hypothetical protein [Rhizobacter sp.]